MSDLIRKSDALTILLRGKRASTDIIEAIAALPAVTAPQGVDALSLAWRLRSYATHDNECKVNRPPHFDVTKCSCGLRAAIAQMDALAPAQPAPHALVNKLAAMPTERRERIEREADRLAALDEIARLGQEFDAETEAGGSVIRGLVEAAEASKGMLVEPAHSEWNAAIEAAAEKATARWAARREHADRLAEMDYPEAAIDAKTVSAKADEAEMIATEILALRKGGDA